MAFKVFDFIVHTNIFISLCAGSLTAWSEKLFLHEIPFSFVFISFCATLLLYNGQRMYLSFFREKNYSLKDWYYKHKRPILALMLVSVAGLYPLLTISFRNMLVFAISFLVGIFYFLPFSNLRSIPVVKSMSVGLVWVLVCVIAPLEKYAFDRSLIIFAFMQLIFVSVLCVLFNIRDIEEDARSGTHSLPVLFGIKHAKRFVYLAMLLYLAGAIFAGLQNFFLIVSVITFILTCVFTFYSATGRHSFFYGIGVDGLILVQSLLGIFLS